MPKLLTVALCWLLAIGVVQAQTEDSLPNATGFYLKASPLAMLETDAGITLAVEYLMDNPRLGFQLEVQPIFFSLSNIDGHQGRQAPLNTLSTGMPLGVELRPELRYYFTFNKMRRVWGKNFTPTGRRNYIALDFLYKRVGRERQSELNVFNGGTNPAYVQQFTYKDIKQVTGFSVKFGSVKSISKNGKWLLEYYAGIGSRHKTFSYQNIPAGVAPPNRRPLISILENRNGTSITTENGVSVPAGLKLIYQL